MTFLKTLCSFAVLIALAGCSDRSEGDSVFRHLSILSDHQIAVHAPDRADATITATGDLVIAGKPVTLDAVQQQLAIRYFTSAVALRNDAITTGAAGIATAQQAISSVASGLASGDPDRIGDQVDASAAKVDAAANRVCADLQSLVSAQNGLLQTLPQFLPYASIQAKEVTDCRTN
ncbi:MAG: hypothetical protein ACREPN_01670 [Rudaea sp.]